MLSGKFGSMLEQEGIDPLKATCSAVQNAVPIAQLLLTEALPPDMPKAASGGGGRPGGMSGMGGMDFRAGTHETVTQRQNSPVYVLSCSMHLYGGYSHDP